jgi:hypothetical protein
MPKNQKVVCPFCGGAGRISLYYTPLKKRFLLVELEVAINHSIVFALCVKKRNEFRRKRLPRYTFCYLVLA